MSAGFPGAKSGDPYGGMTPGDALGGGLTQTDPLTGLPYGAMPTAQTSPQAVPPPMTPGFEIGDTFGNMLNKPGGSQYNEPVGGVNYPGQTFGPRDLSTPGPQPQPQQFPNLMQNPAFNPGIQPPQQMQQIAQGQPTLVNQLAPPPAAGPVPGQSITQQAQPFPQPAPVAQPQPQPLMPPVAQAQPQPVMPTRATQGYQSRVAPQPAPRPARAPARRMGVSRAFARR